MTRVHRPRGIALVGALLTLLLGLSFIAPGQPVAAWVSGQFNGAQESLLFSLTNQARADAGVPPVRFNSSLRSIARWRSQDMAVRGYFAHEIPPDGKSVFVYMQKKGLKYRMAGENIGWNNVPDNDATRYMQTLFMESEGHRANILARNWDSAGIGAFKGTDGAIRYTVLFMQSAKKPASQPASVARSLAGGAPLPAGLVAAVVAGTGDVSGTIGGFGPGWDLPPSPDGGGFASAGDAPRRKPDA
jgi:uncharacterized protein YkwD